MTDGLVRNDAVAVGTTPVLLSYRHPSRIAWAITNTGATQITIDLSDGGTAASLSGIVLQPKGAAADSDGGDYKCWKGGITVISDVGGGTVGFMER